MQTTLPANDPHLNETPASPAIFAAITAVTSRDIKSLVTTLQRGMELMSSGEYFWVRTPGNDGRYRVENIESHKSYTVWYHPASKTASCSCEACVRLGTCKHLVAIHLHQAEIDAECDARERRMAAIFANGSSPLDVSIWK